MNKIKSLKTGFGWIDVNNKRYDYDIILNSKGYIEQRNKSLSEPLTAEYGHTPLSNKELLLYLDGKEFDIIYIGNGQSGAMPITKEAEQMLSKCKTVVIKPTSQILQDILKEKRKYVAILHTTC